MVQEIYEEGPTILRHPFSCIISGSSQSGKTFFVNNFIKNLDSMVHPRITDIVLSYSEHQNVYKDIMLDSRVRVVKGDKYEFENEGNKLVIIDDQMQSSMKSKHIEDLFTKGVHHRSVSVILISQDLYPSEKCARTIRRNATYLIIFKSVTFRSQIQTLGMQLYPDCKGFLGAAYAKATENPYTYLFVNLHPTCNENLRIRSHILPFESEFIYVPYNTL